MGWEFECSATKGPKMTTIKDKREPDRRKWLSSRGPVVCAAVGALYAVLGAFPVAALLALVYRFPMPMVGYSSGIVAMMLSPIAVILYGIFGGFLILAVLGAAVGWMAHVRHNRRSYQNKHREILIAVAVIDCAAMTLLAVWDKIYGPW